jgi:hypothetical protein
MQKRLVALIRQEEMCTTSMWSFANVHLCTNIHNHLDGLGNLGRRRNGGCLFRAACYAANMTKLLDDALKAARDLPADAQDSIARIVLRLSGNDDEAPAPLSPDEHAAIAVSKAAAARGEFASEDQVRAVWAKHNL